MDNVFGFREQLVEEYGAFSRSFTRIAPDDTRGVVEREYSAGRYRDRIAHPPGGESADPAVPIGIP